MLLDFGYVLLKNLTIPLVRSIWIKKITGLDNIPINEPAIIIANHASYLDFLILGSIVEGIIRRPLYFWANSKVCNHPVFKYYTKCFNSIEIDYSKPRMVFWKTSIERINKGHLIGIFPEGTRTRSGSLSDFNLGYIRLASATAAKIIPINILNTFTILPPHKTIPNFARSEVIIHAPVDAKKNMSKDDMISLNNHIRDNYFCIDRRL